MTSAGVLNHVLDAIESARICPGSPKEHFTQLLEKRGGSVCGANEQVAAFLDDRNEVVSGGTSYFKTVRRCDCEVLCSADTTNLRRCPCCKKYRSQLHVNELHNNTLCNGNVEGGGARWH